MMNFIYYYYYFLTGQAFAWHNYCKLNEGKNTNGTYNFAKFFSRTVSYES